MWKLIQFREDVYNVVVRIGQELRDLKRRLDKIEAALVFNNINIDNPRQRKANMNVGDLKLLLSQFNDDTPVIVASNPEGNDFHWLDGYGTGFIKTGTLHLESIYDESNIKEEKAIAEEWGDEPPEFDPVIVLWP